MAEGVVVHDREGRIVSSNEASQRLLGLGTDELAAPEASDAPWELFDRDGTPLAPEDQPAMRTLASGRAVRDVVMGLRTPEGRLLWLLVNSVPLPRHADGGGGGAVTTFSDVTIQVQAEQELSDSRGHYRLLAENAADMVFRSTPDGKLQWISPAVRQALGWEPEELVGRRVDTLRWQPEDLDRVREHFAALQRGESVSFDARFATRSGEHRWLAVTARPVLDSAGNVTSIVGGGRDVNAEVEARRDLAASEERFRLLAENSTDVVVHIRDGVWVWVSPSVETEFGGRREDWIGRRMEDLLHPDDRQRARMA